jgi:hypothetical protein
MTRFSAGLKSSSPLLKQGAPTEPVEGDGLQAVRYHHKTVAPRGHQGCGGYVRAEARTLQFDCSFLMQGYFQLGPISWRKAVSVAQGALPA